jgi:hypothetical protein
VTADQQLARIVRLLREAGIDALVMGGHAVRYYGIDRNTIDFDLVTSIATPAELRTSMAAISGLGSIREEAVWRKLDFARFEVGKLPDGRPQWLEFWLRNHLLDDFAGLKARAELGQYGGEMMPFLGLSDLMRSKETERESDWQDIAMLEEIRDDRYAAVSNTPEGLLQFLASLRSRRGMDVALERQLVSNREAVAQAAEVARHPATLAFLFPYVRNQLELPGAVPLPTTLIQLLSTVVGGSPKHFAVVEIARREFKRAAMDRDRADKQLQLRK